MIVDTSALMAIAKGEEGDELLLRAIYDGEGLLPAPVLVEFRRVAFGRSSLATRADAEVLIATLVPDRLTLVPFTPDQGRTAAAANERFGKGHGGTLNLLDLMVYACAKVERRPILCTGRDFAATDALIHPASRTTA